MPVFIRNQKDEQLWARAKALAEKQGQKNNFAYVTTIYKSMKGGKVGSEETDEKDASAETGWIHSWQRKSASVGAPYKLTNLLALLRAAHQTYWTAHWQTSGPTFYGDHIMLDGFYGGLTSEIDGLAEKLVGMGGPGAVALDAQMAGQVAFTQKWAAVPGGLFGMAVQIEQDIQQAIEDVMESMGSQGEMSHGLSNFLEGVADAHEKNSYMLRQRLTPNKLAARGDARRGALERLMWAHGSPKMAASYPGNLGAVEMFEFYSVAKPDEVSLLERLIDDSKFQQAWAFLQKVTGMPLQPLTPRVVTQFRQVTAMTPVNRIAALYASRKASDISDMQHDLVDLAALADNIEAITDTFGEHFKLAATVDPEITSQMQALDKARKGEQAAQLILENAKKIATDFPEDKGIKKTIAEAEKMIERFGKLNAKAEKMIQTISKKAMPEDLKKMSAAVKKGIESKLENPDLLEVIPWQREGFGEIPRYGQAVRGVEYEMVFQVKDPGIPTYDHRVRLSLVESTVRATGIRYDGFDPKTVTNASDVVNKFVEQLKGWPGLKGEGAANAKRTQVAEIVRNTLDSFSRMMSSYSSDAQPAQITSPTHIDGHFRQGRLEHLAEYEQDEITHEVRTEAKEKLTKLLGSVMSSVASIEIHYNEKGHYSVDVELK